MRPYEETWTANSVNGRVFLGEQPLCEFAEGLKRPVNNARAKLAAQAPAMARLLKDFACDEILPPYLKDRALKLLHNAGVLP